MGETFELIDRKGEILSSNDDNNDSSDEFLRMELKWKSVIDGEIIWPSCSEYLMSKYYYDDSFPEGLVPVKVNDKYGFINREGDLIIPFSFDYAEVFSEGLAKVVWSTEGEGFINKDGEIMIPPGMYGFGSGGFSEELKSIITEDGWGFINKKNELVIPCAFVNAFDFSEGLACVKQVKWGFIDKNGINVIPFSFDNANSFSDGMASVEINGKRGFIDKNGILQIPCIYDLDNSVSFKFNEGFAKVKFNGKWGYIDKKGSQYWED